MKKNIVINATAIAKHFGKKVNHWLRLKSTDEFLNVLKISNYGNSRNSENQLVTVSPGAPETGGGTWMHKDVTIEFARWLDPRIY